MNGLLMYQNANVQAAAKAHEAVELKAAEPVPEMPTLRAAPESNSSRVTFALMGTLLVGGFVFALAWGLGKLTGESIFRKVEDAAA